ncbi:MAG: excinuclease ABC subunit UvrC [Alphaproteobacteria bacterium]
MIKNESKISSAGIRSVKEKIKNAPENPGVYRMLNQNGDVLYVGKAKNLKKRLTSYTRFNALSPRIKRMIAQTYDIEIIVTENETAALILENDLIKKLLPRYNILLRDDKSFPFILINKEHNFPKITKHRGRQNIKGVYFGPFAAVSAVNQTLTILQKAFLLRSCSDVVFKSRSKPCLLYQIKRCSAPCVEKISHENYQELVLEAQNFLSGKNQNLQKELTKKMEDASKNYDFELAANFRDRIRALNLIQDHNQASLNLKDADVIGIFKQDSLVCIEVFFYRAATSCGNYAYFPANISDFSLSEILEAFLNHFYDERFPPSEIVLSMPIAYPEEYEKFFSKQKGSKVTITVPQRGVRQKIVQNVIKNAQTALARKLSDKNFKKEIFKNLVQIFNLVHIPKRIEFYDNSHLSGTNAVGALIAADENGIIRRDKRKFYIKDSSITANDPAMMKEVITRRFLQKNHPITEMPDVIFVDGGKPQLNAALSVLSDLNITGITVIGATKNDKHEYEKFVLENGQTVTIDSFSSVFHFIQMLGQEVHNFALGIMTKKKKNDTLRSAVEDIKNIGKIRKKALIAHFGSVKAIADASLDDLVKVSGINKKIAEIIYKHFH